MCHLKYHDLCAICGAKVHGSTQGPSLLVLRILLELCVKWTDIESIMILQETAEISQDGQTDLRRTNETSSR